MFGVGDFFGKVFGTDKALAGIVDGVSSGLDALVYTDEEKAGDAAKDRSEARQMVVQWMASTQGQNLARRLIALAITSVWLGMYLLSAVVQMVAVFWTEKASELTQVGIIAKESANDMIGAVMLILAFYFAAPHMGDVVKAAMAKFGKDNSPTDRIG